MIHDLEHDASYIHCARTHNDYRKMKRVGGLIKRLYDPSYTISIVDSRKKQKPKNIHICICGKKFTGHKKYCLDCEDKNAHEINRSYRDDFFNKLNKKAI